LAPLNIDFIGKYGAKERRVEIRKLVKRFAPRCQWTYGNPPARSTDVTKWHWGTTESKISILRLSK